MRQYRYFIGPKCLLSLWPEDYITWSLLFLLDWWLVVLSCLCFVHNKWWRLIPGIINTSWLYQAEYHSSWRHHLILSSKHTQETLPSSNTSSEYCIEIKSLELQIFWCFLFLFIIFTSDIFCRDKRRSLIKLQKQNIILQLHSTPK